MKRRLSVLALLLMPVPSAGAKGHDDRAPGDELAVFGARGSETLSQVGADSEHAAAVEFSLTNHAYQGSGLWTNRSLFFGFIGGGSAGVEGGLGADIAGGLRIHFAPTHGPIVRLGVRGYLLGNDVLYSSLLELPEGQLGYQILSRQALVEIAFSAGPVLTGRYDVGRADPRKLGGTFEWGGHFALRADVLHAELSLSRLETEQGSALPAIEQVSLVLCGMPPPFGICLDVRRWATQVRDSGAVLDSRANYVGLQIGIGSDGPREDDAWRIGKPP
ncbi:MAG TPA: hypothetical protein VGP93_18475 [Polyangiaceae bacterium]|jgi:hypothetical protein|nr:hypothetical protein [Polyangiaceae bacterium]